MENIERIAREYKAALNEVTDDSTINLEQIIILEENQLDYIDALLARAQLSSLSVRTLRYVKNIIFQILNKLNALQNNPSYVPSFRAPRFPCQGAKNNLLSSQISIYALYDKIPLPFSTLSELLSLENRKTALLSAI